MKKITIIGVGGVGGYFGGKLAQHYDVTFIARGQTLEVLQNDGLKVESVDGEFQVKVKATDIYEPTDLLIIATKAHQLRQVVEEMRPAIAEKTLILPLLNGVDAVSYLHEQFGNQVIGGFCKIISFKIGPAHIRALSGSIIDIGEVNEPITERLEELAELFRSAEINTKTNDDFLLAQWQKMILISSMGAISAVTRTTMGVMRTLPEIREMITNSIQEGIKVAQYLGVNISDNFTEELMKFIDTFPEDGTTSMQRDIMEGRPSELEFLIGNVVKLGKNIDIPLSRFLYYSLLPQENAARK